MSRIGLKDGKDYCLPFSSFLCAKSEAVNQLPWLVRVTLRSRAWSEAVGNYCVEST